MKHNLNSLVVDLSAVLELISGGNESIGIRMWLETAGLTYAADQLHIDLADHFRELVIEEKISGKIAVEACLTAQKLIDRYVSTSSLWQEALFESLKFRISVREMIPLILARKINAGYLTRIERKKSIAESLGLMIY